MPIVQVVGRLLSAVRDHKMASTTRSRTSSAPVPKVFLSYRRDDSVGHAGRIHGELQRRLGPNRVFRDIEAIPLGADFINSVETTLAGCRVVVAVIGRRWLTVRRGGARRLDDVDDLVRRELAFALHKHIPVIPVLVDGAAMPQGGQLPNELQSLSRANSLTLHDDAFDYGMARLVEAIDQLAGQSSRRHPAVPEALKSLERPNNLPIPLTSFIGRRHELEELKLTLAANRLVTLTGAGGCGKTRLALRTAAEMLDEYPDGAYFVDLSPMTDQSLIAASIAAALALRERSGRSLEETVSEYVAHRKLLLVLDNCEHLLDGCASLTVRILAIAPELHVLATSQQPLNVPGEVRWRVPSLGLPSSDGEGASSHSLIESEAVQLFVERARLAKPGFALDDKSGLAVAQICSRLDGIPLAIELAAAKIAVLTPNDIVARLDYRFRLLGTGKRMGSPRQQTLLAAVMWSHELLDDREKVLFRRLSVFSGGFDLDAAEAVGSGGSVDIADVLGLLTGLVEKSLVVAGEGSAGRARYRLLETLREFARARLIEAGEDQEVRRRHALYYLDLVDDSEHKVKRSDAVTWLDRVDEDQDNARSALVWASERDRELATRLATGWSWYRLERGHLTEGRDSLAKVLGDSYQVSSNLRIDALRSAGALAFFQGDLDDMDRLFGEAWLLQGDEATERSATILIGIGNVAAMRADWVAARAFYARALNIARQCGAIGRQATALGNLGECALWEHDLPAARSLMEQARALREQTGDRKAIAIDLSNLAEVAIEEGRTAEALELLRAALTVFIQFKDPVYTAWAIEAFGAVAAIQQQPERALRLGGAGSALKEKIGSRDVFALEKARSEGHWARMREMLPAPTAEAAWESGKRMTLEEAVRYALSDS